jgi:hypothetical protein
VISHIDRIQSLPVESLLTDFLVMCEEPARVQREVLLDILSRSRDTEWGRRFAFAEIHSVADFRDRVPVSSWDDYDDASTQMQNGATDVLFPGAPEFFTMTSGTTGASKFIPESRAATIAKRITSDTRAQALADAVPGLREAGKILTFANRRVFGYTPCGIEYGTASGSNITGAPPLGPERLAYPLSILESVDKAADVDYLILLTSIQNDVRVIRGNNPGRLTALLGEADARRDELISDLRHGTVSSLVQIDPAVVKSLGLRADPARADAMQRSVDERGALTAEALCRPLPEGAYAADARRTCADGHRIRRERRPIQCAARTRQCRWSAVVGCPVL